MSDRNAHAATAFDYSRLAPEFDSLSKPAKRALLNAGIQNVRELSKWTRKDVKDLHGIGPSGFSILEAALAAKRLGFKTR